MYIDIIDEQEQLTEEQKALLASLLRYTIDLEGIKGKLELAVVLVSNDEIKQLNGDYRKKNEVTDVLSFPQFTRRELEELGGDFPKPLGDIVLSLDRVKEQAESYGHSFERELAFLTVHGCLHLLGYDHDTKEAEANMFQKQEDILEEFNLGRKK